MPLYRIAETVVFLVPGENEEDAIQNLIDNEHRDKHWSEYVSDRVVIGEEKENQL